MSRLTLAGLSFCVVALAATAAYTLVWTSAGNYGDRRGANVEDAQAEAAGVDPVPPELPDTPPPPGLSITPWGPRDCFPVIRTPWYASPQLGESLLAPDEPVLGLIIGNEIRAYSTNQLNEHEMVLDTISGTPVLITY